MTVDWWQLTGRWLKTLLWFGAVGPLVGLVVFAVVLSAYGVLGGSQGTIWSGLFMILYGWILAHLMGGPSALVAGAAAQLLHTVGRVPDGAIGLLAGAVAAGLSLYAGIFEVGRDASADPTPSVSLATVMALVQIAASGITWAIMPSRWR